MTRFPETKQRQRLIALLCAAALLMTSSALLIVPVLAAPGDLTETFSSIYPPFDPDTETGYVNFPFGRQMKFEAQSAFRWYVTNPEVFDLEYDPDAAHICWIRNTFRPGICTLVITSRTGTANVMSFVVMDHNNISHYRIPQGTAGLYIDSAGGTAQIDLWVKRGVNPGGSIEMAYNPGSTPEGSRITWRSDDTDIAVVDSVTGLVTAVGNGVVNVRGSFTDPWGIPRTIAYLVRVGGGEAFTDVINLSDPDPQGGPGWTYGDNVYTVTGDVTIINSTTTRRVVVQPGVNVNITLNNMNIDRSAGTGDTNCAFDMAGATVSLNLLGNNTLKGGQYYAALRVPVGAELTVDGIGSLSVTGRGAGIGGNDGYNLTVGESCGKVTINGGTVNVSSSYLGTAIGGGRGGVNRNGGDGGIVIIAGGSVTAIRTSYSGGLGGVAIGGGNGGVDSANGRSNGGDGGLLVIAGGSLTATCLISGSPDRGVGIGGGSGNAYGADGFGTMVFVSGGTLIASGGLSAIQIYDFNSFMFIDTPTYQWWANTNNADPGGASTYFPPTAYVYNRDHKFIKIQMP